MPFLKRACPITRFRLLEQPTREQLQQAAEHLARHGFRPIDTLPDEMSAGWVSMDDPTDSEWRTSTPDRVAHLVWTLRIDKRSVPAQLLEVRTRLEVKKFLERRREEIKEKVLIPFANKDEKREIRDRVYASLLSQAAPVPSLADVVWVYPGDATQAEIWLCTSSTAVIEKFQHLIKNTFGLGVLPITPFTPWVRHDDGEDWPDNIGNRFLTWLYKHDGHSLDVVGTDVAVNFEKLTIADAAGDVVIKAVTGESDPEEVKEGIANGMLVRDCDVLLNIAGDVYTLRVKGVDFATRMETKFWVYDRDDPDGSFADKVLSVERCNGVWDKLYRLWLVQEKWLPERAPTWEATVDAAVGKGTQNALAKLGAKSVKRTKDGFTAELENGTTMTVVKGGK